MEQEFEKVGAINLKMKNKRMSLQSTKEGDEVVIHIYLESLISFRERKIVKQELHLRASTFLQLRDLINMFCSCEEVMEIVRKGHTPVPVNLTTDIPSLLCR